MAGPPDLADLAAAISIELDRAGIRHAITGSIAMAAHGYVRATMDVDLLVVAPALRWPEVFEIVRRHGFEGDDLALIDALRQRYVAGLRRGTWVVEILVPVLPYHATLLSRARLVEIAGARVPVVSPEDLLVLKLLWHRAKDVADLHALVAARGADLDAAYVEATLRSLLPVADARHAEWAGIARRFRGGAP